MSTGAKSPFTRVVDAGAITDIGNTGQRARAQLEHHLLMARVVQEPDKCRNLLGCVVHLDAISAIGSDQRPVAVVEAFQCKRRTLDVKPALVDSQAGSAVDRMLDRLYLVWRMKVTQDQQAVVLEGLGLTGGQDVRHVCLS